MNKKYMLNVFLGEKKVAMLSLLDDNLNWQYTDDWLKTGFPVSPHLPLSQNIPAINTQRFLRNLLPEGHLLDELLQSLQISRNNTFAFIKALGRDLTGALVITGDDKPQQNNISLRKIPPNELIERLEKREDVSISIWDHKPRLSVAGVQDKINILFNSNNEMCFAEGDLCSTHILKFEKKKQSHLVINEFISANLAKHCGLKVADVTLKKFGEHRALLISRFDRKKMSDVTIKRHHVIDGCQALNLPPEYKYEHNFGSSRDVAHIRDGASLPKLFDIADQCKNPAETKLKLLDWSLFNFLIYNFDAHGKNVSFFVNQQGTSLAPFYDLINISMYPDYENSLAMAFGDEFDGLNIHAYQLADFADSCNIQRRLLTQRLKKIITKILSFSPPSIEDASESENEFVNNYLQSVMKQSKNILKDDIQHISTIEL